MFHRVTSKRPSPSPSASTRRPAAALALGVLVLAVVGVGCPCIRGPVNASAGLRWWLFSNFGASKICPEMIKRGVGLRMQDRGAMVGRFFPNQCGLDVNGNTQTVTVHFSGTGYAYTPLTKRVGFSTTASVEYRPDFYLTEDDIYVWGKVNRIVQGPSFRLGYVENPVADAATAVTPLGQIANLFGNQIVSGELTRGFTVVQNDETETKTFALGLLMPPQKPHTPFDVEGDERHTFANETVQVQWQQRDFLGPFDVVDTDQVLTMKMFLEGPAVDVMVVSKQVGDIWREAYQTGRPMGPPPGPVMAGGPLQPQRDQLASYRLPPGQYFVVIDHSQYAGTVNPPPASPLNPLGGPGVKLSYVAQLADL
jgi:hypothetical protein